MTSMDMCSPETQRRRGDYYNQDGKARQKDHKPTPHVATTTTTTETTATAAATPVANATAATAAVQRVCVYCHVSLVHPFRCAHCGRILLSYPREKRSVEYPGANTIITPDGKVIDLRYGAGHVGRDEQKQ